MDLLSPESRGWLQEEEARRIAYQERLRVAREIHDAVGHGLTVINLQAGTALHVLDQRPGQAEIALTAIKTACDDALEELRAILGVFHQSAPASPSRPAPGLELLASLVASTTAYGLQVALEVSGTRRAVPGPVGQAAYRIVQESLTNVLRHAGQATAATVRLSYEPDMVVVEVLDDGAAAGADDHGGSGGVGTSSSGFGISGMRDRALELGGTLETGPRPGGGFHVLARLPSARSGLSGEGPS